MTELKTKEKESSSFRGTGSRQAFKPVDKARVIREKTAQAGRRVKDTGQRLGQEAENENSYAADQFTEGTRNAAQDAVHLVDKGRKKAEEEVKKKIRKEVEKQAEKKELRSRSAREGAKSARKAERSLKTAEHSLKTVEQSSKTAVKTAEQGAKAAQKTAETAVKTGKEVAVTAQKSAAAAGKAAEGTAKGVAAAVKAAAVAAKESISAIGVAIAAAAPVIILIVVFLAVAVLLTGDTRRDPEQEYDNLTAMQELNESWHEQIEIIKEEWHYDEVKIEGSRATWPEIFSLFSAKTADQSVQDFDSREELAKIFWDMNHLSYEVAFKIAGRTAVELEQIKVVKKADVKIEYLTQGLLNREEVETYRRFRIPDSRSFDNPRTLPESWRDRELTMILTIKVTHRSVEEMAEAYGLSEYQKEQVKFLTSDEFAKYWTERLYGAHGSDDDIVNVALTQLGNSGGQPYWEFCGWPSRVEWCACFITWCGEQCGYIEAGLLPMTSSPWMQMEFFKDKNQWIDAGTAPSPGMIVFYDYYGNGLPDHVGIIENVENGEVHSIEGNWGDSVQRVTRVLGDPEVMGYGWIVEK